MKILNFLIAFVMVAFLGSIISLNTGIDPLASIGGLGAISVVGMMAGAPAGVAMFNLTSITVSDISSEDVEENMGGYTNTAYLSLLPWIATHPSLPDVSSASDEDDLAILTGHYAMESGKSFLEVKVPPRTSASTPEGQGEAGSKSFNNKGSFFVPGTSKAARLGLMRIINNAYGIIIFKDHEGNRIQFGDEEHPCEFTVKGEAGQAPSDRNGFTVEFSTDSFSAGWVYNGRIILSDSQIDPIS